jgi:aminopeptidase N
MKRFIVIFALLLFAAANFGSIPKDADLQKAVSRLKEFKTIEAARKARVIEKMKQAEKYGYQTRQNIDMLHYDYDLDVDPNQKFIGGFVTLTFSPTAALPSLKFRLHKKLNLVSVYLDDSPLSSFSRKKDDVTVNFSSPLQSGSTHKIRLEYGGVPQMTGELGGGMFIDYHEGVPSATTLSEPFEAYAWWPSIDEVSDKFTANINITTPQDMVGASNGKLTGIVPNDDGTTTYRWQEDYPIAAYLIAVSVSNYSQFSDSYTSRDGSKTMPIDYFVYPEHLSAAQDNFVSLPEMIGLYAGYAGEYPFINEKYGHVEFPWGGAMEHQTLTSMGDYFVGYDDYYNNLIYAHELAHMWYGDEVTCGSWHDIWLNEGFATYFEVLWMVHEYSDYGMTVGGAFNSFYDDGVANGALKGTVYAKNDNKPFADSDAIYTKGGWVLHMLSGVMGQEKFWQAMKLYRERHSMSNAVTGDFKDVCSEVYGSDLTWFFDQWVYTGKRPTYSYSYSQSGSTLTLKIEQTQKHKIANRSDKKDVYIMPIDITLYFEDGSEETVTVHNDERVQEFAIPVSQKVTSLGFDEGYLILKAIK